MSVEIERKFLVQPHLLPTFRDEERMYQGYLVTGPTSLRIRLSQPSGQAQVAWLVVKGPGTIQRPEFHLELPVDLAKSLLSGCSSIISKTRYLYGRWEVDRFHNVLDVVANDSLWLAEIELESLDEPIAIPEWCGQEVTEDVSFSNAQLATRTTFRPNI